MLGDSTSQLSEKGPPVRTKALNCRPVTRDSTTVWCRRSSSGTPSSPSATPVTSRWAGIRSSVRPAIRSRPSARTRR